MGTERADEFKINKFPFMYNNPGHWADLRVGASKKKDCERGGGQGLGLRVTSGRRRT